MSSILAVLLAIMAVGGEAAGGWSLWSTWYKCTQSCDEGTQIRQRLCDNPVPTHPADNCIGATHQVRKCNTDKCPTPGAEFVGFCLKLTKPFYRWFAAAFVLPVRGPSYYTVPYDGVLYNNGGYYHFQDHAFHAPTKGVYQFSLTAATYEDWDLTLHLRIKDNGTESTKYTLHAEHAPESSKQMTRNVAATVLLTMNKNAIAYVAAGELTTVQAPDTTFCGMLVQKLE